MLLLGTGARIDRWYLVIIQPTLLDQAAVICAWGSRQTSYQRARIIPAATTAAAAGIAVKIIQEKIKRGYVCAQTPGGNYVDLCSTPAN